MKKTTHIHIRIEPDLLTQIQAAANLEGKNLSEFIRERLAAHAEKCPCCGRVRAVGGEQ